MTLRFHLDRCTAAEFVGWVDDDGPVASLDLEINGEWVCSVPPNIPRPDLAAAGYGDGKRGFEISILNYLRGASLEGTSVALKCNGATLYEGPVIDPEEAARLTLAIRLKDMEARVDELTYALRLERHRVEAALFLAEGLTDLRDEFLRARATPKYQAVFDHPEPLVSVCVTTMNRAGLLVERALESLLGQTYGNLQVIVVGDHCTDDTAEQIARLDDRRISFVNLAKRGPYPRAGTDRWLVAGSVPGNRALELVEGEFVTHLDEDNSFDPRRIEMLLETMRETRADLVFHPFWWEEPDGSWTEKGNGKFELGQTGTSMIFYHRYLARIPWDPFAYRLGEPEDWNRLRKFKMMRVRTEFLPLLLTHHFRFPEREPFVAQPGEEFLE